MFGPHLPHPGRPRNLPPVTPLAACLAPRPRAVPRANGAATPQAPACARPSDVAGRVPSGFSVADTPTSNAGAPHMRGMLLARPHADRPALTIPVTTCADDGKRRQFCAGS